MKKIMVIIAVLFLCVSNVHAEKKRLFPVPYDGGIFDAAALEQIYHNIENRILGFQTSDELLGKWQCLNIYKRCSNYDQLNAEQRGLFYVYPLTLDLTYDDIEQTYNYYGSLSAIDSCYSSDGNAGSGRFEVMNNLISLADVNIIDPSGDITATVTTLSPIAYQMIKYTDKRFDVIMTNTVLSCEKLEVAPDFPTALNATESGGSVTLSWSDMSANESGFRVYRRILTDTMDISTVPYTMIAETGPDINTYTDTDTSSDADHYYKVSSFNEFGESEFSNVVKVIIAP